MSISRQKYQTQQILIGVTFSILMSIIFTYVFLDASQAVPIFGKGGLVFDAIPQSINLAFWGSIIPIMTTRKQIVAGDLPAKEGRLSFLPQNALLCSLLITITFTIASVLLNYIALIMVNIESLSFTHALIYKACYGAVLGGLVTYFVMLNLTWNEKKSRKNRHKKHKKYKNKSAMKNSKTQKENVINNPSPRNMKRPPPRNLEVLATQYVTPHMLRITLGGEGFVGFPEDQESGYVKLVFPKVDGGRPLLRTYTVRTQREDSIDVDFALHEAKGPASSWAFNAKVGDVIPVSGPGPKKLIEPDADWFLISGDMTALPAISVNLATLPSNAKGYAVIEVIDEADIQTLPHPDGIELIWVVNKVSADNDSNPLLERIKEIQPLDGELSVWVACEFNIMRAIRRHLKSTFDLPKTHFYTSSYWQLGSSEDEHKVAKQKDSGR